MGQTINFANRPIIVASAAVGGVKEGKGPLAGHFDVVLKDDMFSEKSWEKAESKMLETAMMRTIEKAGVTTDDVDLVLSGDLINQTMSSSFMARSLGVPFLGLYGACSTMAESLLVGSALVNAGYEDRVLCGASSHYCTAERQFRMPLEHGNQRPPWASWTATAAGAAMVCSSSQSSVQGGGEESLAEPYPSQAAEPAIAATCATIGKVIDPGIKDANEMGAAMAPAAVDCILNHLADIGRGMNYYDKIYTGDLGYIGKSMAVDFFIDAGIPAADVLAIYDDCGTMLYERNGQDVHGGGSGCGCSASVFCGAIMNELRSGKLDKILLVSTGALLSTTSPFQGETIPGIAHAVAIERI